MYYVYQLIDPRCGGIFYVGKGKGRRYRAHTTEALGGTKSYKCNRIRAIVAAGFDVAVEIVKEFKSEDAAYRFEKRLIAKIGLEKLTNIEPGGRGNCRGAKAKNDAARIDRMLGEVLARVLKHLVVGNRIMVFSSDLTESFRRFAKAMLDKYGQERIAELVRPHGVVLTVSRS